MKKKIYSLLMVAVMCAISVAASAQVQLENVRLHEKNLKKLGKFEDLKKAERPNFVLKSATTQLRAAVADNFTLPYRESFDNYFSTLEELGYTQFGNHSEGFFLYYSRVLIGSEQPSTSASDHWLFGSGMELTAGVEYCFELYATPFTISTTIAETFKMAIGTSPAAAAMSDVLITKSLALDSQAPERVRVFFTPTTTNTYYFGVNYCTPTGGYYTAFDDVRFYEVSEHAAEVSLYSFPLAYCTMAPSFLLSPVTGVIVSTIFNTGKHELTNVNFDVEVTGNRNFSDLVIAPSIPDTDIFLAQTSKSYTYDPMSPVTYSLTVTADGNVREIDGLTVPSVQVTDDVFATDNGELITGVYIDESGVGNFHVGVFNIANRAVLKSVMFRAYAAPDDASSLSSVIYIAKATTTGAGYEIVGMSDNFNLLQIDNEYNIPVHVVDRSGIILEPGVDYYFMIRQPAANSLRIHLTTGGYYPGLIYTGVEGGFESLGNLSFWMRAKVGVAPSGVFTPNSVEGISIYTDVDAFNLSYTSDYTSAVIYNISGQAVASYELPATGSLSVSNVDLAKGTYLIRFTGNKTGTVKVVK